MPTREGYQPKEEKSSRKIVPPNDDAIEKIRENTIQEAKDRVLGSLLNTIDEEYEKVDNWGKVTGRTTLRDEYVKAIQNELVYEPRKSSYDQNTFTSNVNSTIRSEVEKFREKYNSLVNEEFVKDAMEYAVKKLRERLKNLVDKEVKEVKAVKEEVVEVVEKVLCSCGHEVPAIMVMGSSSGTSCPDCYDRMSE